MKKLIRNRVTQAFLTAEGTWTTDLRLAQVFNGEEVGKARERFRLRDCELYYWFGTEQPTIYDFAIPL